MGVMCFNTLPTATGDYNLYLSLTQFSLGSPGLTHGNKWQLQELQYEEGTKPAALFCMRAVMAAKIISFPFREAVHVMAV